ncbi:BolA/IbaG family iron-sulfur metabolism protein [Marinobacter bryozoorum]|jgi:acid stress-induced BolA-like protein IbaG/YrbA|uniref:BolA family protein n=1 Tax=Marinobacter bryozoorum TaxID=256324 RepID=UPI00200337E7|nr:BolA/IbaG family iron-sulfur metabolism protein [Marinobacter bryozoorum]MCK7546099.1 BolA/IbaG family iron-sulfur metabolism protein [Marinobacter bryozoorum]
MQPQDVAERVRQELPDCEIQVQNDGNHYLVVAIGDRFEGMSPVKKQQLIYGALREQLDDGTIHALTIRAFTPAQWAARQQ